MGEFVRCTARLHWIVILPPTLLASLSLVIVFPIVSFIFPEGPALAFSIALLLCPATVAIVVARLSQERIKITVTNLRIIVRRGLLERSTVEISVHQIDYVHVRQSLVGRILNFGNITICGFSGREERVNTIENPRAFQRCIGSQ
jgi:uncharacterized membrane protein YdbT with pleckstrin-like domain